MPVLLNNIQERITLTEEQLRLIPAVVELGMARHHQETTEVSLVLVDNDYIQELNLEYRRLDQPTDVLSFAFHEAVENILPPDDESIPDMLGDIYISVERAVEQAQSFGHSVEREICYLAVHGLLHLLGFDHQEPEETTRMRTEEEAIMAEFSLGRTSL